MQPLACVQGSPGKSLDQEGTPHVSINVVYCKLRLHICLQRLLRGQPTLCRVLRPLSLRSAHCTERCMQNTLALN